MKSILIIITFLSFSVQLSFAQKLENNDSIFITRYLKLSPKERLIFFDIEFERSLSSRYFFLTYIDLQVLAQLNIPYTSIFSLSGVTDFPLKNNDSTYLAFLRELESNIDKKLYLSKRISNVKELTKTSDIKIIRQYLSNNVSDRISFLERNFTKLSKAVLLMISLDLDSICEVKSRQIHDKKSLKKASLLWKSKLKK